MYEVITSNCFSQNRKMGLKEVHFSTEGYRNDIDWIEPQMI